MSLIFAIGFLSSQHLARSYFHQLKNNSRAKNGAFLQKKVQKQFSTFSYSSISFLHDLNKSQIKHCTFGEKTFITT
jgi:hypothetical protein